MTKKDYELIASSLKTTLENAQGIEDITYREIVNGLSYALGTENPLFDRTKFLEACGIESQSAMDYFSSRAEKANDLNLED